MNLMKHKRILLFFAISVLISVSSVYAQNNEAASPFAYRGFSGGMMLHAGFVENALTPLPNHEVSAPTTGIGGAIRFHFGKHLRVGTEGYTSNAKLWGNGSYVQSGWGGLLVDVPFTFNRWTVFAGVTVGGGESKGVYMLQGDATDWQPEEEFYYHKFGFAMVDPFFGIEYRLTDVIHVVLKGDWMMGLGENVTHLPTGPRAYIGFMFYR